MSQGPHDGKVSEVIAIDAVLQGPDQPFLDLWTVRQKRPTHNSVADLCHIWQVCFMANALLLEQPLVVHTRPAIDLNDEQLFDFCGVNRDLRIERSADGDILIMVPEGGSSAYGGSDMLITLGIWARQDGRGRALGSSAGFVLPNRAMRSPDVSWVRNERLEKLTHEQWQKFLPLCPDFVLELRSPSDSLPVLQAKMDEYRENGAELGWLLDPSTKRVYV